MTYTVTDITEIARHHLYLTEEDEAIGADHIHDLIASLYRLINYVPQPMLWHICDRCGTSVDACLVNEDGPNYAADGDFYCSDCWPDG